MNTSTNRRKVYAIALALMLVLSTAAVAFAAITPMAVSNCFIGVTRVSDTQGTTEISVSLNQAAASATIKAVLQEKSGTSWVTATGVTPTSASKSYTNRSALMMDNTWNLLKGKNYRIYVTITDVTGGTTSTNKYSSDMF